MGNFERGGNRGGRGGFGSGRSNGNRGFGGGFGGGNRGGNRGGFNQERTNVKFKTVCAECGNNCEIPFKPMNDKPVFCDACYGGKKDNRRDDRRSSSRDFSSNRGGDTTNVSAKLQEINEKLDILIGLLDDSTEFPISLDDNDEFEIEEEKEVKPTKKATKKAPAKKATTKKK